MALIKSIAGVRGTVGGKIGAGLTPIDIVHITAAFGRKVIIPSSKKLAIVGRDARPSGGMISQLVCATLQSLGIDVIDTGLSTTPTVSLAITQEQASGGIVITASHNPAAWNALKLFNADGEYIDAQTAKEVFEWAAAGEHVFAKGDQVGKYQYQEGYIDQHIEKILALPLVNVRAIRERKFNVAVDAVNSTGGLAVPKLLQALQVAYTGMYCNPTGLFPHDPEPITQNLGSLIGELKSGNYDLGIAVDPDVDRLVIIDEKGQPWGEDYTLVGVADYILSHTPGNTVSNLSSSSALQVITQQYGGSYAASPVGEMHVVAKMKATNAVIGGEGNGGIIYPPLHYGRDALVGIALLLSHLAQTGKTASSLRQQYPSYELIKTKIQLTPDIHPVAILKCIQMQYSNYPINTEEGIKVNVEGGWFHIRQSNTEPIIRIHAEGSNLEKANAIVAEVMQHIKNIFPTATIL
jgi:phosphomannomutase